MFPSPTLPRLTFYMMSVLCIFDFSQAFPGHCSPTALVHFSVFNLTVIPMRRDFRPTIHYFMFSFYLG